MKNSIMSTIVTVLLVIVFIYLMMWSVQFGKLLLEKKRTKTRRAVLKKQSSIKQRTIACSKNYWYNIREVEDRPDDMSEERFYHYFDEVSDCVKDLLIEMYDYALVRTEELERIAYGEVRKIDISKIVIDDEYDDFELEEKQEENFVEEIASSKELDAAQKVQIYQCWSNYVLQLYDLVSVNCNEEMKSIIRNEIMQYGHNDVQVLLHSPE